MGVQNTSCEVSAFYDVASRRGLVVGSIEHDNWKSGITATPAGRLAARNPSAACRISCGPRRGTTTGTVTEGSTVGTGSDRGSAADTSASGGVSSEIEKNKSSSGCSLFLLI